MESRESRVRSFLSAWPGSLRPIKINKATDEIIRFYINEGHWLLMNRERMLMILNHISKIANDDSRANRAIIMITRCTEEEKAEMIRERFERYKTASSI
jgi:hypothetical protein